MVGQLHDLTAEHRKTNERLAAVATKLEVHEGQHSALASDRQQRQTKRETTRSYWGLLVSSLPGVLLAWFITHAPFGLPSS